MNWKSRLKALGAGAALIAVGVLLLLGGKQVVVHWTGQPMFSSALIAGGLVLIASAAIPERVMLKLTTVKSFKSKRTSRRSGMNF
jgi:hypothetical protein